MWNKKSYLSLGLNPAKLRLIVQDVCQDCFWTFILNNCIEAFIEFEAMNETHLLLTEPQIKPLISPGGKGSTSKAETHTEIEHSWSSADACTLDSLHRTVSLFQSRY